jgi:hypothetical protein
MTVHTDSIAEAAATLATLPLPDDATLFIQYAVYSSRAETEAAVHLDKDTPDEAVDALRAAILVPYGDALSEGDRWFEGLYAPDAPADGPKLKPVSVTVHLPAVRA